MLKCYQQACSLAPVSAATKEPSRAGNTVCRYYMAPHDGAAFVSPGPCQRARFLRMFLTSSSVKVVSPKGDAAPSSARLKCVASANTVAAFLFLYLSLYELNIICCSCIAGSETISQVQVDTNVSSSATSIAEFLWTRQK